MEYIVVKNFEKYQHYTNRPLIWIKLYRDLLNDYNFMQMPPETRWVLLGLWLLASENGNKTELDSDSIAWRLQVDSTLLADGLKLLQDNKFIRVDSEVIADCQQDDSLEERRGEESREEEKREDKSRVETTQDSDIGSEKPAATWCKKCEKDTAYVIKVEGDTETVKCAKCTWTYTRSQEQQHDT